MIMNVRMGIRKCLSNKKKKRVRKVNQITSKLWYRNDFTFNGNMHNVDLNLQKADAFHSAQILHDTSLNQKLYNTENKTRLDLKFH